LDLRWKIFKTTTITDVTFCECHTGRKSNQRLESLL
jgi:hypothetical protein